MTLPRHPDGSTMLCSACLDTRGCWPCEGQGVVTVERGRTRCGRCAGSGRCPACVTLPAQRAAAVSSPPLAGA